MPQIISPRFVSLYFHAVVPFVITEIFAFFLQSNYQNPTKHNSLFPFECKYKRLLTWLFSRFTFRHPVLALLDPLVVLFSLSCDNSSRCPTRSKYFYIRKQSIYLISVTSCFGYRLNHDINMWVFPNFPTY